VTDNLLDLAVCLEISERLAGERTVDLQAIDEGSDGDEAVGLDILLELVVGLLVEDDGVVGLVLDYVAVSDESSEIVTERAGGVAKASDVVVRTAADCLELREMLDVREVCVAVSRTLALGPLLLLLLASGCYWCLQSCQRLLIFTWHPILRGATYHFVGCVVVLRDVPIAEEEMSNSCGPGRAESAKSS
jgi:hypothetical protein